MAFLSGSFSVGGNVFFGRGAPKTFGGTSAVSLRFLRLPTRIAFRRTALAALFCLLPFRFVSDPLSVFLFFSPALPRRRRGRAVRARRRTFFPTRRQRGGKGKLAGEGKGKLAGKGRGKSAGGKNFKNPRRHFCVCKEKSRFFPERSADEGQCGEMRGNAGKCRKNLFFG